MPKQTRLNEDAHIYQPRDKKTEREKLKEMSFSKKLQYFNEYYRNKVIAILICIAVLASLLYSIFGPKSETILYTAILDGCLSPDTVESFETDMTTCLVLDPDKQNINFDDTFYISSNTEYASNLQQKLTIYTSSGTVDVIIAPESAFKHYTSVGCFTKLSECLPSDLFTNLEEYFFNDSTEYDAQTSAYGIYLDQYAVYDENGNVISRPILGIVANSKYKENAITFIESLQFN